MHVKPGIEEESAIILNRGATLMRVTNTIGSDFDRQRARERIQKQTEEGTTLCRWFSKIEKRLTLMTIEACYYHLGS